jgi:hypothetical protein
MNGLTLRIQDRSEGEGQEVRVLIDGRDLVDIVRDAEARWAKQDGQPQLAGSYSGLWPELWDALPEQYGDGSAAVLGCECGEPGCWPLRVRITISETTVTWDAFSQPHRPAWRYEGIGPFVFSRADYDAALAHLRGSSRDSDA